MIKKLVDQELKITVFCSNRLLQCREKILKSIKASLKMYGSITEQPHDRDISGLAAFSRYLNVLYYVPYIVMKVSYEGTRPKEFPLKWRFPQKCQFSDA